MKSNHWTLLATLGFVALLSGTSPALAQTAPSLGTAASFAVLGGSTVTNTGSTTVTGDLGVSPGAAITGFPPGIVTGTKHLGDVTALQAQNDVTTAYNFLASQPCGSNRTGQDLGGLTLTPGVYCFSSSAQLTGTLTLDALGNANAVFIFQIGTTLTTASNSKVLVINGGSNCNVFWQVGSSATLGTTTAFVGDILALTSITLNTGAGISGRTLARNGAVTLDTNSVNASTAACGVAPPPGPAPAPAGVTCPSGLAANGAPGTATVTLSAAAPAGGTVVTLASSAPGTASVPASVIVPAGATSATFTVTPGATPGPATISAMTAGGTVTCSLTVGTAAPAVPPAAVTCPPGGLTVNGVPAAATVTLSAPAPAGGTVVTLTSSAPGTVSVPASVVILAGTTSATFTETPGATPGTATISAATAGGTVTCTLTVGAEAAPVPTLDFVGLGILIVLLAGAGLFVMSKSSS